MVGSVVGEENRMGFRARKTAGDVKDLRFGFAASLFKTQNEMLKPSRVDQGRVGRFDVLPMRVARIGEQAHRDTVLGDAFQQFKHGRFRPENVTCGVDELVSIGLALGGLAKLLVKGRRVDFATFIGVLQFRFENDTMDQFRLDASDRGHLIDQPFMAKIDQDVAEVKVQKSWSIHAEFLKSQSCRQFKHGRRVKLPSSRRATNRQNETQKSQTQVSRDEIFGVFGLGIKMPKSGSQAKGAGR